MPHFLLALYDAPEEFAHFSPEEMQRIIQKYRAWSTRLRESGLLVTNNKLKDEPGRVLRKKDGQTRVVDGPYSETKEVLGGYFVIEARDYHHAVTLSQDCPHLDFNGTIELREVDPV